MASVSPVEGGSRRAIFAALAANAGIALSKLVGFFLTGAASLAAEAIHSIADTANQGLLLLGGHRAQRGEDERHPFGHGRERYFWAFVVALVLFASPVLAEPTVSINWNSCTGPIQAAAQPGQPLSLYASVIGQTSPQLLNPKASNTTLPR